MAADCSEPPLKSWADLPTKALRTDVPAAQDMLVERPLWGPLVGPLFVRAVRSWPSSQI